MIRKTSLALVYLLVSTTMFTVNKSNVMDKSLNARVEKAMSRVLSIPNPSRFSSNTTQVRRQALIRKCIKTIYGNYLRASGDIRYDGVVPAHITYDGLWAWDSWKHAFALAFFDKELAESSVRAMFDYQDSAGMVIDCIFPDKKENNARDSKPPLAVWAVYNIYKQNNDIAFLKEMYSKLIRYHYWWYSHRDNDGDGLCEYGSTDGTLEAARWESGWDNAIRFDNAEMLKNGEKAFSMNIESVDLNSYLYFEKVLLAKISGLIGNNHQKQKLIKEAKQLAKKIQMEFFDDNSGFFYDKFSDGTSLIFSKEASGWIPLFAKVATTTQAEKVKKMMMDKKNFDTFLPLPTASADQPGYAPEGYWRGSLWMDQFYFGIVGLRNYGYNKEADYMLNKLISNAEGLSDDNVPFYEYYNSATGKGKGASSFSWTAACLLMLLISN